MHAFHFDDQYNTYHSTESCMVLEGQQAIHADQRKGAQEGVSLMSPLSSLEVGDVVVHYCQNLSLNFMAA